MAAAFVSLATLLLSCLALHDIYHGEADTSAEWTMVRVALAVFGVFVAMTIFTLKRVLGALMASSGPQTLAAGPPDR